MRTRRPEWTSATEAAIERERERLGEIEGVVGDVVYGDASEELARFAAEVDLLIVGSRGYGPLGRLINGSTSTYLAGTVRAPGGHSAVSDRVRTAVV